MKKFIGDFKKFISRGNVVDMAVGVAVASAFTAIVTAFTKGFISPLLALLSNDADLAEFKLVVRAAVTEINEAGETVIVTPEVAILWGGFVQAILNFLIVALCLFTVMRIANKMAERAKKAQEEIKNGLKSDKQKAEEEAAKAEEEAKAAAKKAKEEAEAAAKLAEERAAEVEIVKKGNEKLEQLLSEILTQLKENK